MICISKKKYTYYIILPDAIKDIIRKINNKYTYARENDCFYNPSNYLWYLGKNTLDNLQCCFDEYVGFADKQRTADILREIRVELDLLNPDGLRLFKEIK